MDFFHCNICFVMTIIGHIITALILYANHRAVNHCWMIYSKSTDRLHVFIQLKYTASCFLSTDYDEEHLAPLSDTLNDMCRAAISLADNDFSLHLVAKCANNEDAGRKKHLCWLTFPSLIRMHRFVGGKGIMHDTCRRGCPSISGLLHSYF